MLKLIRNRAALVLAGLIAALCPMLMAPSGGFPSRPLFQAVGVGVAVPATGIVNAATDVQIAGTSVIANAAKTNVSNTFTAAQTVNVAGAAVTLKGAAVGALNQSYVQFTDSGATRTGYVGDSNTADLSVVMESDSGDVRFIPVASTGTVSASYDGGTTFLPFPRWARANIGGSPCITAASINVASCSRGGVGAYTITINTGVFTLTPTCTFTDTGLSSNPHNIGVVANSATSVAVQVSQSAAAADSTVAMICVGV